MPVKQKVLLPSEDELERLVKLQSKWEEKTRSRKTGKTFVSGSLYRFIQRFPFGYHSLDKISSHMLSPLTIEKHIECLIAVGILEKDKNKRVALSIAGKKIARVLHKFDQDNLEEYILNRLGEMKREHSRRPADVSRDFKEKLCGHCRYKKAERCLYRGHCERRAEFP